MCFCVLEQNMGKFNPYFEGDEGVTGLTQAVLLERDSSPVSCKGKKTTELVWDMTLFSMAPKVSKLVLGDT